MRALLTLAITFLITLPAMAQSAGSQASGPQPAGDWNRMPREARTCYMAGAAAGARAFAETQPNTPLPARIRVDQAVTNMDHLASDPMYKREPLMAVALKSIMAAQDTGTTFVETGKHIRDAQFDAQVLFDYPVFEPIDLEGFVPTYGSTTKRSFAQSWLSSVQPQKMAFAQGFGDMVVARCVERYNDTPAGSKCMKPLLPLPMDMVLMEMDSIYRDHRYINSGYDLVIRAALAKMSGDDWQGVLGAK